MRSDLSHKGRGRPSLRLISSSFKEKPVSAPAIQARGRTFPDNKLYSAAIGRVVPPWPWLANAKPS